MAAISETRPTSDTGTRTDGPHLPPGVAVYAVGDIHGRHDLLGALHARIVADAQDRVTTRRVIVYLGDYIDRGPDSRAVIDLVRSDLPQGFEKVRLRGNHEDLLIRFLHDPHAGRHWLLNGGETTLASYGIDVAAEMATGDMQALQQRLHHRIPHRHRDFLEETQLSYRLGDYFFTHAGVRPGVPLDRQRAKDLLWIREDFLDTTVDHGAFVVHGHTPVLEPEIKSNRAGIDTGAVFSGRLTALALFDGEQKILQAIGPARHNHWDL